MAVHDSLAKDLCQSPSPRHQGAAPPYSSDDSAQGLPGAEAFPPDYLQALSSKYHTITFNHRLPFSMAELSSPASVKHGVSPMAGTLNFAGLDGLLIDAENVSFIDKATKASAGYTVSATKNHNLTSFFSSPSGNSRSYLPSPGKPVTLHARGTLTQGFTVYLTINQKSDIPGGFTPNQALTTRPFGFPDLFKLGGWNADAILLIDRNSSVQQRYVVISDQPLTKGTPANLTFSNTGSGPTINGISLIICFAGGTRLATAQGYAAVEHLQPGDLVRTLSGALQPIVWVGQRTVTLASHPQPGQAAPICIAAHAFGPGLPLRELAVSPEHALFVDRALVPAQALVNGATIRQVAVDTITYYHVELPQHDVVLAEGLPAETYLDTGSRTALTRYDRLAHAA